MGIKHFWHWYKSNFGEYIKNLRKQEDFNTIGVSIDNLMIDLNGVFHNSTQKVYQYGNCKPQMRLLRQDKRKKMGGIQQQKKVFADVCSTIESLFSLVGPNKRLILCIDGPAPLSKQNQQRQRRFRSAMEKDDEEFTRFDSNCITGDSLISIGNGRCRPIKILKNNKISVMSLSDDHKSIEYTNQTRFYNQGIKNIITITFQDGRTISCTPDHEIMTDKGEWVRADKLGVDDKVSFSVRGIIDIPQEDEKNYNLSIGDFDFFMDTEENREKLLAFARINGILLSDGCSANYIRKTTGKSEPYGCVTLGSIPDAQVLLRDIEILTNQKMSSTYDENRSFKINLPAKLSKAINETGVPLGARINQEMSFPSFIMEKNCPVSVVREFLGGYFGGDGHAPGFGKNGNKFVSRGIKFSHGCRKKFRNNMIRHMEILTDLLEKCGVKSKVEVPQIVHKGKNGYKNNCEESMIVHVSSVIEFVDNIGFRYCHSKAIRAEAIASYERLKNMILNNRQEILSTGLKHIMSGMSRKESYNKAVEDFLEINTKIHLYCIPSYQSFSTSVRNGLPNSLKYIRGLSLQDYLKSIGALRFFGGHTGGTDRVEKTPVMSLRVISTRKADPECTYDISVSAKSTSFLANGIGVHNCITPGTKFMDYLSKYIDWYIKKRITENVNWKKVEVVFSNEKSAGEGEHKIINYIRKYGDHDDSFCIHGLDADLIMLALGTHLPNFWILREDMYDYKNEFFVLDIGQTRKKLSSIMSWVKEENKEGEIKFNPEYSVNDFIFICFMVGNDFLPHIPSIEIIEGGIDFMLDVYKNVGERYGHLTSNKDGDIVFQKKSLEVFMGTISQYNKGILEDKLMKKDKFFPDLLLENSAKIVGGKYVLDIDKYKKDYYKKCFADGIDIKKLCHEYLEGMQWVLSYYTRGVPDWKWCFKHHYAPFAHELAEYIGDFKFPDKRETEPTKPFQQLLSVLPPKSFRLIPIPICQLLTSSTSPVKKFCPDKFEVDISGKRREWEGIVLLPMVDFDVIEKEYTKHIDKVDKSDLVRNKLGKSFIYKYDNSNQFLLRSYYGNIDNCCVAIEMIDI